MDCIADDNINYVKVKKKKKKKKTFIIVNNNKNNCYNYTENANYIVAMFNDLLSRFSKARKIKWLSLIVRVNVVLNRTVVVDSD